MEVIDPGHFYSLKSFDSLTSDPAEYLIFVKREGENYPGNEGAHRGTTSQEVLRALIERSEYVNNQKPCAETEAAIGLLKAALLLFELRAARYHERFLDLPLEEVINGTTCSKCGHSGCQGNCH